MGKAAVGWGVDLVRNVEGCCAGRDGRLIVESKWLVKWMAEV